MIYSSGTWVIELAQGRQQVRAAGNKNSGINHVSDRPDLCQITMTTQPFLEKSTERNHVRKAHTVLKLLEKQLCNQKTSVFLRISRKQFPGCGIYYIFTFAWQKYVLEDVRIMFKYFRLQSWHSEAGWNVTAVYRIKALPAGWLKHDLGRWMDSPSLAFRQLVSSRTLILKI